MQIPDTISFSQAATISGTFHTAISGLCLPTHLNLQWPGDPFPTPNPTPILVWGAGSGVGRHCVQILKAANYSNIIATAAPYRFDDVKSVGAKVVFNYKDADVVEQIQKYLGDEKLLHSYDAISTAATLVHLVKLVSPGGTIALVSFRCSLIIQRFTPTTSEPSPHRDRIYFLSKEVTLSVLVYRWEL